MTKYSSEIIQEICKWIEEGNSQRDAAILSGIAESTFYEWAKQPEFSEALKKSETRCKAARIQRILKAGEKQWQADAWWLERKFKDEFARLEKTEVTQTVDTAKELLEKVLGE